MSGCSLTQNLEFFSWFKASLMWYFKPYRFLDTWLLPCSLGQIVLITMQYLHCCLGFSTLPFLTCSPAPSASPDTHFVCCLACLFSYCRSNRSTFLCCPLVGTPNIPMDGSQGSLRSSVVFTCCFLTTKHIFSEPLGTFWLQVTETNLSLLQSKKKWIDLPLIIHGIDCKHSCMRTDTGTLYCF